MLVRRCLTGRRRLTMAGRLLAVGRGGCGRLAWASARRRGVAAAGYRPDHHVDAEHGGDRLLEQVLVLAAKEALHVTLTREAEGKHPFVERGHTRVADNHRGNPALGLDRL